MSANATSLIATSSSSTTRTQSSVNWGRYSLLGLGTVVAAVLANTVFYYLAAAFVAYDPEFIILTNPSGAAIFTLVPAVVATLLYAGLLRFTRHAVAVFNVISALVFVVTLIPDFTYIPTVDGASNGQTAVLILMHVIAAAVIVRMLTSQRRRDTR